MALRAQKDGNEIMIDFHYSDSWADPGKQFKPAAWENSSRIIRRCYAHTYDVIDALKVAGVTQNGFK
jgi:arabinogalactan endo-1,4-beta-galactosidase